MFDNLNEALKLRDGYGATYVMGTVVSNKDDASAKSGSGIKKDRIQVSVPGLYDPGQGEIPWIGCLKKSPFGQSKNWGVYGSPYPGSDVALELQDGNPHYAMYHSIQRYPSPQEFSKPGLEWGFKDPAGNVMRFDLDDKSVELTTVAGVVIKISSAGELTITAKGDMTLTSPTLRINADIVHTGTLHSNGVNVGSDHTHTGVMSGASDTGTPNP